MLLSPPHFKSKTWEPDRVYLFFERKVGHAFRQLDFNVAKEVAISQKKRICQKWTILSLRSFGPLSEVCVC